MTGRTVVTDAGAAYLIKLALKPPPPIPWVIELVLYADAVDPTHATTWADLTEVTDPNYTRRQLDPSLWSEPVVAAGVATCTYGTSPQQWVWAGPDGTVAGAAVVDAVTNAVLWLFEFDAVEEMAAGDTLSVLPRLTLATDTCTP